MMMRIFHWESLNKKLICILIKKNKLQSVKKNKKIKQMKMSIQRYSKKFNKKAGVLMNN